MYGINLLKIYIKYLTIIWHILIVLYQTPKDWLFTCWHHSHLPRKKVFSLSENKVQHIRICHFVPC